MWEVDGWIEVENGNEGASVTNLDSYVMSDFQIKET